MRKRILTWIGILLAGAGSLQAAKLQSAGPGPADTANYRALVNRYCIACHNEKLKTAGLSLDNLDVQKIGEGAPVWEKVVRKLRTRGMPPVAAPRPDEASYESFATYLETALDRASEAKPNPGRVALHRLNRAEYTNVIRDLLGVEIDGVALLPADDSGYGFDNIGDVLSVSPMLLERYLSVAGKVARLAIGDQSIPAGFETYEAPRLLAAEDHDDRLTDGLPFGTRGGLAVTHFFPVDGEYTIQVRMARNGFEYIRGIIEPHQLEIMLDGVPVKQFTVGGEHKGKSGPIYSNSGILGDIEQELYERRTADLALEVRLPVKAGTHAVAAAFTKEMIEPEGVLRPRRATFEYVQYKGGDPSVGSIIVGGPFSAKKADDSPSRRKIFVCHPSNNSQEEPCARRILSTLARRAYRRPVSDADVSTLMSFYQRGRGRGDFEAGIGMALRRMLVDSEFLMRIERDPANVQPGDAYRISDLELASRLSFFLWSSMPDDQLLDLASRGKLKDPAVLEQQVRRMLADERSNALVDNFAGQWLYLRNMRSVLPDPAGFPDFDDNLRAAFQRETGLFFQSMMREDRSVVDLLDANYAFVNERLARHYGIPNVYGSHFRRVTLSAEERRGLLGQGTLLTVTSYANRTSPVLRGKWVLENILGTPPPPPPPNVPSLKENGEGGKMLSMRERMEQHRANPVCASCHSRMDPLGFALENFDGVGKWRVMSEGNTPLDTSGALPDGTKFRGPAELRKVLVSHPQQFVTTFTEKLLTYAMGRGVEYYDQPEIRTILRNAALSNYRWSAIVMGIAKSTPFQMRRVQEP